MIVYVATNKKNGKKYIGYTLGSLATRISVHNWKAHHKKGKHYNYLFQRAIRKYTITGFTWDILYTCSSKEECCNKEKLAIKQYNTMCPNGYNLTEGGDGGIQSIKTRLKISRSLKAYHKKNPGKGNTIMKLSPEARHTLAKKAWITKRKKGFNTTRGFKHSSTSKEQMSITKNSLNKLSWVNILTGEEQEMSLTDISKHTKLSVGTFSHLHKGRQERTKCGWMASKKKKETLPKECF